MPVRPILRMGDPRLLQVAQPVKKFDTPELRTLIQNMFDTMHALNGAGIAAPQIGVDARVIIFGFDKNPRYPQAEPVPITVLINPIITFIMHRFEEIWEGCLSVPGLRGVVSRPSRIHYSGYDVQGNFIEREAEHFHARVVQHECDHLDGMLFPRRIHDLKAFGFEEELKNTIFKT